LEPNPNTPLEKRRVAFLKASVSVMPFFGIISAAGYGVLYLLITPAWQLLAVAGISLVSSIFGGLAYLFFIKGKPQASVITFLAIISLVFPGFALFWSGTAVAVLFVFGTWVISGVVVYYGTTPGNKRIVAMIGSVLSTVLTLWIDNTQPFPRLDIITDLTLLRWLIPLITILGGSLLLILVTRIQLGGRIFPRTLAAFMLVVFIPLVSVSTITTISSLETDRRYAISSLETISTQKSNAINLWLADIQVDVYSIPHEVSTDQNILLLLQTVANNQEPGPEKEAVIQRFGQILAQTNRLEEIFLMDPDGIVIASSNPERMEHSYTDQEFFQQGKSSMYVSSPYLFQDSGEMSIFSARPVLNTRGQIVGVLAGRANMRYLSQIATLRTGLGNTGKSLLISSDRLLLNGVISGTPSIMVNTSAATQVITSRGTGSLLYTDQNNNPVVGVYTWIPSLQAALITEMDQSEAFGQLQYILIVNIVSALIAAALAFFGSLITVRTISSPLNSLVVTAKQVTAGNYNARTLLDQEDEIGDLGQALNSMTAQIGGLVGNLETKVEERTRELERRTTEIRTAAQIARDASTARNLDDLLTRSSRLIHDRFGFYHVGIFLVDEKNEYAVLIAAAGEAGQLMLANNHKLKIGEVGIVGHVAETGHARVVLDTGEGSVYFHNPLLPFTHSEMALPLNFSNRVIGVLDVQSDKSKAFDQQDVDVLQIMADQIAVAIERTTLVQELEQAVSTMEISSQEYTKRSWRDFYRQAQLHLGYSYQGINAEPINTPPPGTEEAINSNKTIIQKDDQKDTQTMAFPIQLRGLTLGALNLRFSSGNVSPQTIKVIEETANRLALALENTRLIQNAQRLAVREQQVNVITTQIQQSTDIKEVLQNAVRELGKTLGVPRAFVQLGINPVESISTNTPDPKG
jgi:GAF domain-containing protein/HAMP domain-containing protein